nr:NADH dehydrogenase subunit 4L [Cichlidogyrus cirratus]
MLLVTLLGCLVFIFGCFSAARLSFISLIIFLELVNVLVLLASFVTGHLTGSLLCFLSFIVVATMEVVISLVSLTRLWRLNMFCY